MQNQHTPVLIFAQNGRFLAQSATQSGYRVWVADCFGDLDLIDSVERWQALPPISELKPEQIITLLSQLSNGEDCTLICGTGIENCFQFLQNLPNNIKLIGNSPSVIKTIKTPSLFFTLLQKFKLPYPETHLSLSTDTDTDTDSYITKSSSGFGGLHIQKMTSSSVSSSHYFQRIIDGESGSVLFLANGKEFQLLNINHQILSPTLQSPFRLARIDAPWNISANHLKILNSAIHNITAETALVGLNSLDFIISTKGDLFILEINPRPSASAELIDNDMLFKHHINACHGVLPSYSLPRADRLLSLKTIYADHELTIPTAINWPIYCRDIPHAKTIINEGEPIFTSFHDANSVKEIQALHQHTEQQVINQLSRST